MTIESKSKGIDESVGRKIAESIGWAGSTFLVLTAYRAAATLYGFAESFSNKSWEFYYGIRRKFDEMQLRRTIGTNQKGRHG